MRHKRIVSETTALKIIIFYKVRKINKYTYLPTHDENILVSSCPRPVWLFEMRNIPTSDMNLIDSSELHSLVVSMDGNNGRVMAVTIT